MKIADNWTIEDPVSGLRITAHKGKALNRLTIEYLHPPIAANRDFFFTKNGKFDGTGTALCDQNEKGE